MGKYLQRLCLTVTCCILNFCSSVAPKPLPVLLTSDARIGSPNVVFGEDFYAVQSANWAVKNSNLHPIMPMATGNLDFSFGPDIAKVDSTIAALKPLYHRTHIINTTCVRDGNCGNYEIGHGYNKATFDAAIKAHNQKILNFLKARVTLYKALSIKYPGTTFLMSPALEHDLSKESWNILADTILSVWPDVQLVNSPDANIAVSVYKGSWIERHTNNFPLDADIVSLDGADATDINITAYRDRVLNAPHVKIALSWTLGFNCRVKTWIDPRARKNCPSRQTFELMSHIMEPVPNASPFTGIQCKKITPLNGDDIWKPLAESYSTPDPRQELPVCISGAFKAVDVNLIASNGMRVGTLGFYGAYGKQFRWYSGYKKGSRLSGYEFQKKAVATSGSPYTWIVQNGLCKGPFVPGRRGGITR